MKMNRVKNKKIWSHHDFSRMGWHDCKIHGFAFNEFELLIDLDYIFKWIKLEDSEHYLFNVSPSTLIFKNVWDLKINLEHDLDILIEDIYRENPCHPKNVNLKGVMEYDWSILTSKGEISFKSIGYEQYNRNDFFDLSSQSLEVNERGGISFTTDITPL